MSPVALAAGLRNKWQGTEKNKKFTFIIAAAAVLLCLAFLGHIATRTVYATLFSGLEPKDAGYIVEKLKSMKVPYKIEDQGGTIKVPEAQVYEARIQLAGNGALGGVGMGFELFDQNKFGQTDFEQQVGYQRAIQEELRRTLVQLEGITQARVHLVIPQKSVFISDQGTPTASVALKLKPWAHLKPEQVQGICDLIVGSVEGLKPENVHIIDTEGNVLSDNLKSSDPKASLTRLTLDQQKAQREYENELEKRVQQVLARLVGYDENGRVNAVSMVTAQIDFSQRQTTSTSTSNPDNLKVSEHILKESGIGSEAGNPPGTDSLSIPFSQGSSSSNYSHEENTVNYQANTRNETVVEVPGKVRRLSAAVVVNAKEDMPVDVQKIKEVIAAAIGYDQSRGDQINVSSMIFDTSYQDGVKRGLTTAEQNIKQKERIKTYSIAGGALVAVIIATLLAIMLSRRRRSRYMDEEVVELVPAKVLEIDREQRQREEKQLQIKEMAREKPEYVAEILRIWLREKGG